MTTAIAFPEKKDYVFMLAAELSKAGFEAVQVKVGMK
jgi:hypothetical protein